MKQKQEGWEVYKEKMELAIAEYKLGKEDPASKVNKTLFDEGPSWEASNSEEGSTIGLV